MRPNYPAGRSRIVVTPEVGPHPDSRSENALELTAPESPKIRRRNQQIEEREQQMYFAAVNACLDPASFAQGLFVAKPDFPGADLIYAVPNQNAAGVRVGEKLRRAGVRRGVPDICVDVPRTFRGREYHGLRIEMKRPAGVLSDVKDHQQEWHERLRDQGYRVEVCFGYGEAWDLTRAYLGWECDHE